MSAYPVVAKYFLHRKPRNMEQPTALQPGLPPVGDEGFGDRAEVREAREIYRTQKLHLRKLVERSICRPIGSNTTDEAGQIAAMLHDFAGTAAYFGETGFGATARRLERAVTSVLTARLLTPLCAEILAGLGPRVKR